MKLIFVTSEQFDAIWNKTFPASRVSANLPTPNLVLAHLDTVLVLGKSVRIGSIQEVETPDTANVQWYMDLLKSNKPFQKVRE